MLYIRNYTQFRWCFDWYNELKPSGVEKLDFDRHACLYCNRWQSCNWPPHHVILSIHCLTWCSSHKPNVIWSKWPGAQSEHGKWAHLSNWRTTNNEYAQSRWQIFSYIKTNWQMHGFSDSMYLYWLYESSIRCFLMSNWTTQSNMH